MKQQVSILGCGWLGFPLAKRLIQKGWSVKGSTTSASKFAELKSADIQAFLIELQENELKGDIEEFLKDSSLLVLNIPPGLRGNPKSNFTAKLKPLIDAITKSSVKHILYVSSTGVFKDHESMPSFTEHYRFTELEKVTNQLVQSEQLLLSIDGVSTSIIRFAGLVGNERHPVHYLSGKTDLKNSDAPVNLIHLDNCLLLLSEIIQQEKYGMVFHGVEDIDLSKKAYYTAKAKELDVAPPGFKDLEDSKGKHISMEWTARQLGVNLTNKVN